MEGEKSFGALLRRHRAAAGLTQEAAVADRSGLSVRAVRGLERDEGHRPRPDTIGYLSRALGLSGAEREAFEIAAGIDGARDGVPEPSAVPDLPPEGLVEPPTPLVGRNGLVERAVELVRDEGARLLTLTGPGGVGKTRVGLRVVDALAPLYNDGAASVGLGTVGDPGLVVPTVVRALGLLDAGSRPPFERLLDHLRDKEMLLFLDNFEQVLTAAPSLTELLAGCPGLKVLVTSRAALRVRGEQELAVAPLGTPEGPVGDAAEISSYPAVALFVGRARSVDPSFRLTDENGAAVAGICRRLDGLPLAIELAASRVKLLPPEALLARLEGFYGLGVLSGGGPDLPERQRTMRATIAWSYDLLGEEERALFRCLGAFVGGFEIGAAEAVCSLDPPDGGDVFAGLVALADASLLRREAGEYPGRGPRLTMLGTIQEYAAGFLATSGGEGEVRGCHTSYFARLAEEAEPHLAGSEGEAWLDRLEAEHGNLRAALGWAREHDLKTAMRLAGALRWFWWTRGYIGEGRDYARDLLRRAEGADLVSDAIRAKVLYAAGELAHGQGDLDGAVLGFQEALGLYRRLGDEAGVAAALVELGAACRAGQDSARATALSEEGLALSRSLGDDRHVAISLNTLGHVARGRGEARRAAGFYEESLARFEGAGDKRGVAYSLGNLGKAALEDGRPERALGLHERSLGLYEEIGDRAGQAFALVNLGDAATESGDPERAASLYARGLKLYRELGNEGGASRVLGRLSGRHGESQSRPGP